MRALESFDRSDPEPSAAAPTATPQATPSETAPANNVPADTPAPPAPDVAPPAPATAPPAVPSEPPSAPTEPPAPSEPVAPPPTALEDNQIIVYYGTPLAGQLGILGTLPPEEAARQVAEHARTYDSLNGDLGAVGALDVIYSLAQGEPTNNGMYIRHLEDEHVARYLQIAEEHDLQLFLDLQIGRARILDEVRNIERFLRNPRVHVAIDPEYAVGPDGVPIATPGRISGDEINEVQTYLREFVAQHNLPGKILVVHQYMDDTIVDPDRVQAMQAVDFVLNMDAFGEVKEKIKKYSHFSAQPHSKHDAFNVFFVHDQYVLSEEEITRLSPMPRIVFYQ
jgi:hypothetical protein